jgi:uncharacterized damage-inducible protein DinB
MDREEFLHYFDQVRERTMRVVRCIPPDKFDWTCREGAFTLGDLVRHLAATERYVFAECACGRPSRYKGCGRELADGRENIIGFLVRMHAESMQIFREMSDDQWNGKGSSPDGHPITAWKLLRSMLEHEIHHRGQIYLYLGILGVPAPPLYGLTEPQVARLSAEEPAPQISKGPA